MTKTALLSGGTSGVGLSIVKALIKNNFNVYFTGSNKTKGLKIEAHLKQKTLNKVKFTHLDLSVLNDVNAFSLNFNKEIDSLDLIVNVAGVLLPNRTLNDEGIEKTFAIGYLSTYLLIKNLTPLLKEAPQSRIVNVSGNPIFVLKKWLNFDDFNQIKSYNQVKAAITSVHAKTVLTAILSEQLVHTNITVNAFHPGLVKSSLTDKANIVIRFFHQLISPLMKEESETGIYVCLSQDVKNVSGKLFKNKTPIDLNFERKYKDELINQTKKILAKALT